MMLPNFGWKFIVIFNWEKKTVLDQSEVCLHNFHSSKNIVLPSLHPCKKITGQHDQVYDVMAKNYSGHVLWNCLLWYYLWSGEHWFKFLFERKIRIHRFRMANSDEHVFSSWSQIFQNSWTVVVFTIQIFLKVALWQDFCTYYHHNEFCGSVQYQLFWHFSCLITNS